MSAEIYNKIRRILFCTANDPKKGFSFAYEYMEKTYRKELDEYGYVGLMAELRFYERHAKEYFLTVAGDVGEHADFAGMFGTLPVRFDVTTNIKFKEFETYEPYMGTGPRYKIALLDKDNFEVIDIYDLAFPRCEECGDYLIPALVLLSQNYNNHGESQWTNDQLLINVCTGCHEYFEKERFSHHWLSSPQEFYDAIEGGKDNNAAVIATEQHIYNTYKYFRCQYSDYLMAVGSQNYINTGHDGDGYWAINFDFVNRAVSDDMPIEIEYLENI